MKTRLLRKLRRKALIVRIRNKRKGVYYLTDKCGIDYNYYYEKEIRELPVTRFIYDIVEARRRYILSKVMDMRRRNLDKRVKLANGSADLLLRSKGID